MQREMKLDIVERVCHRDEPKTKQYGFIRRITNEK
jgi:hypothetical protein